MLARPEIGTREHITLWLNGKAEGETFNWQNLESCARGQYSQDDAVRFMPAVIELGEFAKRLALSDQGLRPVSFGELRKAVQEEWA